MKVETTRFGRVQVDDDRIVTFATGLLGFSEYQRFALLQPDDDGLFFWLQSVDSPELAFVVTDPTVWLEGYQATIRQEQMAELSITSLEDVQVLVLVNRYEGTLTANMQGPLVINIHTRQGMQLVLAEKKWTTRHTIVELETKNRALSA